MDPQVFVFTVILLARTVSVQCFVISAALQRSFTAVSSSGPNKSKQQQNLRNLVNSSTITHLHRDTPIWTDDPPHALRKLYIESCI